MMTTTVAHSSAREDTTGLPPRRCGRPRTRNRRRRERCAEEQGEHAERAGRVVTPRRTGERPSRATRRTTRRAPGRRAPRPTLRCPRPGNSRDAASASFGSTSAGLVLAHQRRRTVVPQTAQASSSIGFSCPQAGHGQSGARAGRSAVGAARRARRRPRHVRLARSARAGSRLGARVRGASGSIARTTRRRRWRALRSRDSASPRRCDPVCMPQRTPGARHGERSTRWSATPPRAATARACAAIAGHVWRARPALAPRAAHRRAPDRGRRAASATASATFRHRCRRRACPSRRRRATRARRRSPPPPPACRRPPPR